MAFPFEIIVVAFDHTLCAIEPRFGFPAAKKSLEIRILRVLIECGPCPYHVLVSLSSPLGFSYSAVHSTNSSLHCRIFRATFLKSQPISFPSNPPTSRSGVPLLRKLGRGSDLVSNSDDNVLCTVLGIWNESVLIFVPNCKPHSVKPESTTDCPRTETKGLDGEAP